MTPFKGTFDHTLDAKSRVTVPSKFREAFKAGAVLVQDTGQPCVAVYPEQTYTAKVEGVLSRFTPFSDEREALESLFYAGAFDQVPDAANRLLVPSQCLEHAGLDKEVKVIGKGDHLELWAPGNWAAYEEQLKSRHSDLRALLARSG